MIASEQSTRRQKDRAAAAIEVQGVMAAQRSHEFGELGEGHSFAVTRLSSVDDDHHHAVAVQIDADGGARVQRAAGRGRDLSIHHQRSEAGDGQPRGTLRFEGETRARPSTVYPETP